MKTPRLKTIFSLLCAFYSVPVVPVDEEATKLFLSKMVENRRNELKTIKLTQEEKQAIRDAAEKCLRECLICHEGRGANIICEHCRNAFHDICIEAWWERKRACPLCGGTQFFGSVKMVAVNPPEQRVFEPASVRFFRMWHKGPLG